MKCQHKYPNKGGCGKTATFRVQKPGRVMNVCHSHLSPTTKLLTRDSRRGFVEVYPIGRTK